MEKEKNKNRILQYKVGDTIYGLKIQKIYFANQQKEFIILRADNNIQVYGGDLSEIEDLIAECRYLIESLKISGKAREVFDYQRAIAMNTFLLGKKENGRNILMNLKEKLEKRKILCKKLWYIGIFLSVTIIMILGTLFIKNWEYIKLFKIATFGSIGGFISLNMRLEEMKFEISESTLSYILVSLYKVIFSMLASIVVYFLIESDLIFGIIKSESSNQLYFLYVIATISGFSESLLPNIFKEIENKVSE